MKYFLVLIILFLFLFNAYAQDDSEIWLLYLKGNYRQAEILINDYLSENKYIPPSIYYIKAQILMKQSNFRQARNIYDRLLQSSGNWREYGLMGLGDSYFLEGKFKNAQSIYQTFLKRFPQSALLPFVLYKLANVLRKQGKWEQSKFYFRKVIEDFPKSIIASSSRKILAENEFYFTLQVGSFLNYDNAYNLKKKLENLGFNAEIKNFEKRGEIYYRVRVGRYNKFEQLQTDFHNLLKYGYSPYIYP